MEWDQPGRGKGDGAVTLPDGAEVRYFRCVLSARHVSLDLVMLTMGSEIKRCLHHSDSASACVIMNNRPLQHRPWHGILPQAGTG